VGSVFEPIRFLCRFCWFLYTLNIHLYMHIFRRIFLSNYWWHDWEKWDEKCAYMFNVYKNQLSRQTGSRNLTGPKSLPTIRHTYMKLVTKYQIPVINSCLEKCDEKCAYTNVCSMCIKINKIDKQEVEIWWVQKPFPRYGVPIWLWEAFLDPSDSYFLFVDFVDFYTHLTYICICTFFVAFF
jgi:hypothetical protein